MEDILSFCEQSGADLSEDWIRETMALEGHQHLHVLLYLPADQRSESSHKNIFPKQ